MFVGVFGLEDTTTCDLISLLKNTLEYDSSQKASQDELERINQMGNQMTNQMTIVPSWY